MGAWLGILIYLIGVVGFFVGYNCGVKDGRKAQQIDDHEARAQKRE
jgi:hypothetical protein